MCAFIAIIILNLRLLRELKDLYQKDITLFLFGLND